MKQKLHIRLYQESELEEVVALWRASKQLAFPYIAVQQSYTLADDTGYFQSVLAKEYDIWLAENEENLLGMMAIKGDFIDQLFIAPSAQRQGVGTALLQKARELAPERLRCYTFQKNYPARAFYEKHGFLIIGAGLSPDPENEPDLEYCWQPTGWRTKMKPGKIRVIAICVFLHRRRIFVFEGHDTIKEQTFYRPLGGQVDFGETSAAAVRREFREEINAEIINLRYLQTLENIFTLEGQSGHEVVFVYQGDFADKSIYEFETMTGLEDDGTPFKALWKPLADFKDPNTPLYPDGLLELLAV